MISKIVSLVGMVVVPVLISLIIWDAESTTTKGTNVANDHKPAIEFGDPEAIDSAYCVAFSPDSSLVACGHRGKLRIWDIQAKRLKTLVPHPGAVFGARFLTNSLVVTNCEDRSIRIWDISAKVPNTVKIIALKRRNECLACSSNKYCIFPDEQQKAPIVYDYAGHTERKLTEGIVRIEKIASSPDGNLIASIPPSEDVDDVYASIWDLEGKKNMRYIKKGRDFGLPSWLSFTEDSKCVVIGYDSGFMTVWSVAECSLNAATLVEGRPEISSICSWNRYLFCAPNTDVKQNGEIVIWDFKGQSKSTVNRLAVQQAGIRVLAVSPNGEWLASSGLIGTVCLWEIKQIIKINLLDKNQKE